MGKSRRKSRKYKGGNLTSVDCAKNPTIMSYSNRTWRVFDENGGSKYKTASCYRSKPEYR